LPPTSKNGTIDWELATGSWQREIVLFDAKRMAKEQKQEQNLPPVPEGSEITGPPKSYRLYIALGFVSLILLQTIVLALVASALARHTPQQIGLDPVRSVDNFGNVPGVPPNVRPAERMNEIQIGTRTTFNIRNVRDDANEVFSLIMHVSVRQRDARQFERRFGECENEVIDRVTAILSASTTEERREAGHTAIKERVRRTINDVLGTPWVQQVFFAEITHEVN